MLKYHETNENENTHTKTYEMQQNCFKRNIYSNKQLYKKRNISNKQDFKEMRNEEQTAQCQQNERNNKDPSRNK